MRIASCALRATTVAAVVASSSAAFAAWSTDPAVNNPICMATGNQSDPQMISDGAGGAFITWDDRRGANMAIYVQRIDVDGVPLWPSNGNLVWTSGAGDPLYPQIISDGADGALIVWYMSGQIYAQRVSPNGTVQSLPSGAAICTAHSYPRVVSDGAGGAILVWPRLQMTFWFYVLAQRFDATGAAQWGANGLTLSTGSYLVAPNAQVISDGAGGAIIVWQQPRVNQSDILAQRVSAAGTGLWAANGTSICTAADNQSVPQLIADSAGGALITWQDARSGSSDIYAQRINASGTVQWTADGTAMCTATGIQGNPQVVSDGAGGAIVTWEDQRSIGNGVDIYAQHFNASGGVQWTANGVAICTQTGHQEGPQPVSDGASGAIITWHDTRSGLGDLYIRRVDATGTPQWTANGVALATAINDQVVHQTLGDGSGGAIAVWQDYRVFSDTGIYSSRIGSGGVLVPVTLSAFGVEQAQ